MELRYTLEPNRLMQRGERKKKKNGGDRKKSFFFGRGTELVQQLMKFTFLTSYPTAKVNNDIELEKKAIMKLQSFHAATG